MTEPAREVLIFVSLAALPLIFLLGWLSRRRARRQRLEQPFSIEEEAILSRDFPRYHSLPDSFRSRFAGYTRVIMEEKNFEACGGLVEVTPEMKLLISAQAALLILNLPRHDFFPQLKSILVYPGAFRDRGNRRFDLDEANDRSILYGESLESGSVILSWDNVVFGARNEDDGMNVVIHEFAHQLDQGNGLADGVPNLHTPSDYPRWSEVFRRHYDDFVAQVESGRGDKTFLDPYGATDPAEFFAVLSETFFELPEELNKEHPELYEELARYYRLDPASWRDRS